MHAWFGGLWCHVEPDTSCHGQEAIRSEQLGVFEQVVLAVVRARGENVRERSVVVIP